MRHFEQPMGVAPRHELDWWGDVDEAILACLDGGRMMTTGEIAQKL